MRLIDAEALRKDIVAEEEKHLRVMKHAPIMDCMIPIRNVIDYIIEQPTVDTVREAKWATDPMYGYVYCSGCGHEAMIASFEIMRTRYCPNCGAKMEEPNEDIV